MKRRKNASVGRGREAAGEGTPGRSGGAGRTSTDQPTTITFATPTNGSNPHRGSTFQASDFIPATTPSVALATDAQQDDFCQAVVDHLGIKPACLAFGLKSASVFYWANTHPTFREKLKAAQAAEAEDHAYRIRERNEELLRMSPDDMNKCANAYRIAGEQDMRMLGKLNARLYGDQPGTQINVQNNTGIICDEPTRARLIELNQKINAGGTQTKQLDQ